MNFLNAIKKLTQEMNELSTDPMPQLEANKNPPRAFAPKFDPTPEEFTIALMNTAPPKPAEPEMTAPAATPYIPTLMKMTMMATENPLQSINAEIAEPETPSEPMLMPDETVTHMTSTEFTPVAAPEVTVPICQAVVMTEMDQATEVPEPVLEEPMMQQAETTFANDGVRIEVTSSASGTQEDARVNVVKMELHLTPEQTLSLFRTAMTTQRSVMTLGETADYLRLTAGELYEMAENGIIPSFTVGSQIRFMKATIDQWIESNSQCETSSEIGNAA